MTPLDPRFEALLAHLHRGGAFGFWTYESEARKADNSKLAAERHSVWFQTGKPATLPPDYGPHGPRQLYFGVHPTTHIPTTNPKGEPRKPQYVRSQVDTIAALNCYYAEFDGKDFANGKAGALAHIKALKLPPSAFHDSGGGYHCFWLFCDPWILSTDEERERAKQIQHAWVLTVGGDKGAKNLNRVLRIPGTKNYKAKYGPDFPTVAIIECDMGRLYTPEQLNAIIPPKMLERAARQWEPSEGASLDEAAKAARYLGMLAPSRCDEYNGWLEVGAALSELGLVGLGLWDQWSQRSAKYKAGECESKWGTLKPGDGRTLASLAYWAKEDNSAEYERMWQSSGHANGHGSYHAPESPPWPVEDDKRTSDNHLSGDCQGKSDKRQRLYHSHDMGSLPSVRWLPESKHQIPEGGLTVFWGETGGGKTFWAIDRCARISQTVPVVYVAGEGAAGIQIRLEAWRKHHKMDTPHLYIWTEPVPIMDKRAVQEFINEIAPIGPKLVVLDTLARCMVGGDENSNKDMGLFVEGCATIQRATGAGVMVLHHPGRAGDHERGATSLKGAADVMIALNSDDGLITISCAKPKDTAPFKPSYLRLLPVDLGRVDEDGEAVTSCVVAPADKVLMSETLTQDQQKILETLAMTIFDVTGAKTVDIERDTGISGKRIYRRLEWLKKRGYVAQTKKFEPWFITQAGREALAKHAPDLSFVTDCQPIVSHLSPTDDKSSNPELLSFVTDCHPPLGVTNGDKRQKVEEERTNGNGHNGHTNGHNQAALLVPETETVEVRRDRNQRIAAKVRAQIDEARALAKEGEKARALGLLKEARRQAERTTKADGWQDSLLQEVDEVERGLA